MSRVAVILLVFGLLSVFVLKVQANDSCSEYVKIYAGYDELVNGKLVQKYSVGEMMEWTKDSTFDGFLLTDKVPSENVLVDFVVSGETRGKALKVSQKAFSAWKNNSSYKQIKLDLKKFLVKQKIKIGSYTVVVKHGEKILCEETQEINLQGH
ncbi:MAG: hypothetical protein ACK41T_10940 [Pseudobdellovibrio sp.]